MNGYQIRNVVFLPALLPGMVIPEMTACIRGDANDAGNPLKKHREESE